MTKKKAVVCIALAGALLVSGCGNTNKEVIESPETEVSTDEPKTQTGENRKVEGLVTAVSGSEITVRVNGLGPAGQEERPGGEKRPDDGRAENGVQEERDRAKGNRQSEKGRQSDQGAQTDASSQTDASGQTDSNGRTDASDQADSSGRTDASGQADASGQTDGSGRTDSSGQTDSSKRPKTGQPDKEKRGSAVTTVLTSDTEIINADGETISTDKIEIGVMVSVEINQSDEAVKITISGEKPPMGQAKGGIGLPAGSEATNGTDYIK